VVARLTEQVAAWSAQVGSVTTVVARHLGADDRLAELVVQRFAEAEYGDVRMNCDLCAYRVRLPGYEDKQGLPLSLAPAGGSARGWRARRAANQAAAEEAERRRRPRIGLGRRRRPPPSDTAAGAGGAAASSAERVARPVVRVEGLVHRFPDGTEALRGVDLVVGEGERVALLGPNGSGKTTLALHLIGALERQAGIVEVAGLPVVPRNLTEIRRQVGLVFQDPDDQLLLPTVGADVALGPTNLGLRPDEVAARVRWALGEVGLEDLAARAPQHLSLGERRRAALAGILAMRPRILVLDEPSANLDPSARRDLADILAGIELTTIVVTHDLSLALELCPRSVVVDHGRIAADGPTRRLLANRPLLEAHRLELPFGLVLP
jgi:cobalt/nickel transport system ATP-binding protein